jgi:hypothetical protein
MIVVVVEVDTLVVVQPLVEEQLVGMIVVELERIRRHRRLPYVRLHMTAVVVGVGRIVVGVDT